MYLQLQMSRGNAALLFFGALLVPFAPRAIRNLQVTENVVERKCDCATRKIHSLARRFRPGGQCYDLRQKQWPDFGTLAEFTATLGKLCKIITSVF
jgi:hypothetical protein